MEVDNVDVAVGWYLVTVFFPQIFKLRLKLEETLCL